MSIELTAQVDTDEVISALKDEGYRVLEDGASISEMLDDIPVSEVVCYLTETHGDDSIIGEMYDQSVAEYAGNNLAHETLCEMDSSDIIDFAVNQFGTELLSELDESDVLQWCESEGVGGNDITDHSDEEIMAEVARRLQVGSGYAFTSNELLLQRNEAVHQRDVARAELAALKPDADQRLEDANAIAEALLSR